MNPCHAFNQSFAGGGGKCLHLCLRVITLAWGDAATRNCRKHSKIDFIALWSIKWFDFFLENVASVFIEAKQMKESLNRQKYRKLNNVQI